MKIRVAVLTGLMLLGSALPATAQAPVLDKPAPAEPQSDPDSRASLMRDAQRNYDAAAEMISADRFTPAVPLAERALSLSERATGPDSRFTLGVVGLLGALYQKMGRYAEAERWFLRLYDSLCRQFGCNNASARGIAESLAEIYLLQGRRAEAFRIRGIPDDGQSYVPILPPRETPHSQNEVPQ